QALDLARQHKEHANEAVALHQLGIVYAHADPPDAEQAETHYQQALALAEELGMRPLQAHCHRGLGTLYAATGQRAAGPRCPNRRHGPVPRHGHDILAASGGGGVSADGGRLGAPKWRTSNIRGVIMAERKRMTTRFKELFEQKQFFVMAGGMNPI